MFRGFLCCAGERLPWFGALEPKDFIYNGFNIEKKGGIVPLDVDLKLFPERIHMCVGNTTGSLYTGDLDGKVYSSEFGKEVKTK